MVGLSFAALTGLVLQVCMVSGQKLSKPAVRDSIPWEPGLLQYLHGPSWKAKEWPAGTITQRCKEQAADNSLDPTQFRVYEIEYDDCPGAPWLLCRHINSQTDIVRMMDRFGRVPIRMRQFTRSNAFIPQNGLSAYAQAQDIVYKGQAHNPWVYLHETMHAMEWSDAFNSSVYMTDRPRWLDAYNKDEAVPDEYSRTNHHENVAQHSGILIFDKVYPGGVKGFDPYWAKYANQQAALDYEALNGKYNGNLMTVNSGGCTARYANSPAVSASSTSRVKRWLDPRQLLPSGIVTETLEQQRAKFQKLGITLLDDLVKVSSVVKPTTCSF